MSKGCKNIKKYFQEWVPRRRGTYGGGTQTGKLRGLYFHRRCGLFHQYCNCNFRKRLERDVGTPSSSPIFSSSSPWSSRWWSRSTNTSLRRDRARRILIMWGFICIILSSYYLKENYWSLLIIMIMKRWSTCVEPQRRVGPAFRTWEIAYRWKKTKKAKKTKYI